MQIKLYFSFNTLNLPIAYNVMIQGMIYRALLKADFDYSEYIHNKGKELKINEPKLFTFGKIIGNYRINNNNIIFRDEASLEIRSQEDSFVKNLISGLKQTKNIRIGRNEVVLTNIDLTDYNISDTNIQVITQTPFCFKGKYPEDNIFDEQFARARLLANAKTKWVAAGYNESDFFLDVDFSNSLPEKIQCVFKGTYITAWKTQFSLSGSVAVLNFLYNVGIGARNSQGFGMFDII